MRSDSTSLIKCCNRTGTIFGMKTYRDGMMERTIFGKCRNRFWYFVFTLTFSWFLFVYFYKSTMIVSNSNEATMFGDNHASSADNNQEFLSVHLRKISHQDMNNIVRDHENESISNEINQISFDHIKNSFKWGDWVKIADEVLASENETQPVKEVAKNNVKSTVQKFKSSHNRTTEEAARKLERKWKNEAAEVYESCKGKFIYVHHLPRRFNEDLIRHCRSLSNWNNMCKSIANKGLGPRLSNYEKVYSNTGWFATDQFLLEVIFHNRMKQYKCLTTNSSLASAIFVPYYPGLDLNRYLWSHMTMKMKDLESLFLVKWLRRKPEWKRMQGRDHFLVAGRISWDFRRESNKDSDWGNKLLILPETKSMTTLVIESSPWNNNDFAIPYPTYFHPSTDDEVFQWQDRMRGQKRTFLFSFAGGARHHLPSSVRKEIIDQCKASRKCKFMECQGKPSNACYKPVYVMKTFQSSVFCLQPAGDSFTRRSTFDSILAGCIPVFFHPGSAYVQYIWHLSKNYTKYSVFIPDVDIKHGRASIERILSRIPQEEVLAMREEVIRLIPRVIYADPSSRLKTLEDAFDITVKGVLDRIESIRREMSEEKTLSTDLAEKVAWKYNLFGTLGEHEWDPFFARPRII